MFVDAIEEIKKFTRPVHTIMRHYSNDFVQPGAATLFFVNEEGVAVTCKHVLDVLLQQEAINLHFRKFNDELQLLGTKKDGKFKKQLQTLELKYGFNKPNITAELKITFIDCFDIISADFIAHPTLDLAILKFKDFKVKNYSSYSTFIKDTSQLKPGRTLCRYGYPFAEFTNFEYDKTKNEINFNTNGNNGSPPFPLDGIITRLVSFNGKEVVGIEMSTPGLRGQSGGPLFDSNGLVCGLQSETVFFHLGFNEKKVEIITNGKKTNVLNETFFNAGRCVHVDAIKDFLKLHKVKYYEQ